jgi:type IV secretory pathway VirB2 component (pilin)
MKNSNELNNAEAKQWLHALVMAAIIITLFMMASHAHASTADEFQAATEKFEGWVTGNLGKLAALICVAVGSIVAAVKKDWSWFMGSVVLAMGVGILIGIINASFTATL